MSDTIFLIISIQRKKPTVPNLPVATDIPTSVSRSFHYTQIPKCTAPIEHSQIIPPCTIFCTLAKRIVFADYFNYFCLLAISYPVKYTRIGQFVGCIFILF